MWWFIAYCLGALLTLRFIANTEKKNPGFFDIRERSHIALWTVTIMCFWWLAVLTYICILALALINPGYGRRLIDRVKDRDRKKRLRNG